MSVGWGHLPLALICIVNREEVVKYMNSVMSALLTHKAFLFNSKKREFMKVYILAVARKHTYSCARTCERTRTPSHMHACTRTRVRTCALRHVCTRTRARGHVHKHAHGHAHKHTHGHAHKHAHGHVHKHARTHAHTHAHQHIFYLHKSVKCQGNIPVLYKIFNRSTKWRVDLGAYLELTSNTNCHPHPGTERRTKG